MTKWFPRGPALLWWSLVRAGHRNAAILDGGMRQWTEDGYLVTPQLTPMIPSDDRAALPPTPRFPAPDMSHPVLRLDRGSRNTRPRTFNPEFTLAQGSLRTADEIRAYFDRCQVRLGGSYQLEGNTADAPFLVYLLHLLGFDEADFDPVSSLLQIAPGG